MLVVRFVFLAATFVSMVISKKSYGEIVLNLQLTANGSSRWSEYFSDAYGQLDQDPDGYYLISSPGTRVGAARVIFPNQANFSPSYTLGYDNVGLTSVGNEIATITSLVTGFRFDIADDDSRVGGYTEMNNSVNGTVSLTNGIVTGANLTSSLTFTYDASSFGLGSLPYTGTFGVTGNSWNLLVDETRSTGFGPIRYSWDASGNVAFAAVPEPSCFAMLGLVLSGLLLRYRGRFSRVGSTS